MSAAEKLTPFTRPPAPPDPATEPFPRRRRWTVAECRRMLELGILSPEVRTELIDGDIYEKHRPARPDYTSVPGDPTFPQPEPGETPRRKEFTREEYYRLEETGFISPDSRTELIDGDVVELGPMNTPHAVAVRKVNRALRAAFGDEYDIQIQLPVSLMRTSEPEPDVAAVLGQPDDFLASHPTTAALAVEVSDSSLALDRRTKASLYARAGIGDYWIVNLADRRLEVRRDPGEVPGQPFGFGYRSVAVYTEHESVAPLALPDRPIRVADLFPLVVSPPPEEPR